MRRLTQFIIRIPGLRLGNFQLEILETLEKSRLTPTSTACGSSHPKRIASSNWGFKKAKSWIFMILSLLPVAFLYFSANFLPAVSYRKIWSTNRSSTVHWGHSRTSSASLMTRSSRTSACSPSAACRGSTTQATTSRHGQDHIECVRTKNEIPSVQAVLSITDWKKSHFMIRASQFDQRRLCRLRLDMSHYKRTKTVLSGATDMCRVKGH